MVLNIIHKPERTDRYAKLMNELSNQNISDYRFWDGIHAETVQKGVNLAHKQIVRYAKEMQLSKVLISEDDLKFTDNGAFEYYLNNEPNNYDLYLASIFLGKIVNGIAERFTALTLYMVAERFYDTFLSTPDHLHIDHALAGLGRYVVCEPFICTQHNGHSDNTGKYQNYDILFENRKLYKYNYIS